MSAKSGSADAPSSGVATEDGKKPLEQNIILYVKGDGNEIIFRIKRNTKLKRVMNAYCDTQSVEVNSFAFLFHGRKLRGDETPDELEMKDGDEIGAILT